MRRPGLGDELVPPDPKPLILRTLLGVVVGVAGFSLLLFQLYRYDFTPEFRSEFLLLLIVGTVFLLAGRFLGAFGNRLLLLFLLVLFGLLGLYAELAHGLYPAVS
jgi:membrane-bound ClpP family serine protease